MAHILLDTNAYSLLLKGNANVRAVAEGAEQVYVSAIVVGELLAGFRQGTREKKNIRLLDEFVQQPFVSIATVTTQTAVVYAQVVAQLRKNSTPIPMNDVWIASQALELGATLITFDQHFLNVAGLQVWPELRLAD